MALEELALCSNQLTGKSATTTSDRSELVCSGNIPNFSKNTALVDLRLDDNKLTCKSSMMSSDHS